MELPENPSKKIGELFNEGFTGLDKVNNCTEATNSSTVQACYKNCNSTRVHLIVHILKKHNIYMYT